MEYKIEQCRKIQQQALLAILKDLPQWFGIPSAIDEYMKECAQYEMISIYHEQRMIGFASLKPTSEATLEIYVMGILSNYRNLGLGNEMMKHIKSYAIAQHFHYLQVKTLSLKANDRYYIETYAFYKANGFEEVEVLPLWDEWNPCLLMIQSL